MERTSEENREIIRRNGLPELPEGNVTKTVCQLFRECWWAKVDQQWYWLDVREGTTKKWVSSVYGPGSVSEQ